MKSTIIVKYSETLRNTKSVNTFLDEPSDIRSWTSNTFLIHYHFLIPFFTEDDENTGFLNSKATTYNKALGNKKYLDCNFQYHRIFQMKKYIVTVLSSS